MLGEARNESALKRNCDSTDVQLHLQMNLFMQSQHGRVKSTAACRVFISSHAARTQAFCDQPEEGVSSVVSRGSLVSHPGCFTQLRPEGEARGAVWGSVDALGKHG